MNQAARQLKRILSDAPRDRIGPFSETQIESFSRYYLLVLQWNEHLHLTTLTTPREFAERHLFESASALGYLSPEVGRIWDLGSGLGVPGIPLAILRHDLPVTLVEAQKRKAIFLKEAVSRLGLTQVRVLNSRLETIREVEPDACVTARALERMERLLPEILRLGAAAAQMLLFGGPRLLTTLRPLAGPCWGIETRLSIWSEQRLLLDLRRFT